MAAGLNDTDDRVERLDIIILAPALNYALDHDRPQIFACSAKGPKRLFRRKSSNNFKIRWIILERAWGAEWEWVVELGGKGVIYIRYNKEMKDIQKCTASPGERARWRYMLMRWSSQQGCCLTGPDI